MTEKRFKIYDEETLDTYIEDTKDLYSDGTPKTYWFGENEDFCNLFGLLNSLNDENEQLKRQNQEYKAILQDMGMLMSDEEVIDIRNEIADKFLKPLFKDNGFDVDINTDEGFTIIPKGDVE